MPVKYRKPTVLTKGVGESEGGGGVSEGCSCGRWFCQELKDQLLSLLSWSNHTSFHGATTFFLGPNSRDVLVSNESRLPWYSAMFTFSKFNTDLVCVWTWSEWKKKRSMYALWCWRDGEYLCHRKSFIIFFITIIQRSIFLETRDSQTFRLSWGGDCAWQRRWSSVGLFLFFYLTISGRPNTVKI